MNNSKENQKLEIGDVVRLKSGGPKMTVAKLKDEHGNVYCVWFAGEYDKHHLSYFSSGVLKKEE